MNVNAFLQKDYENEPPSGPNKQTQFKPNLRKAKMNFALQMRRIWENTEGFHTDN